METKRFVQFLFIISARCNNLPDVYLIQLFLLHLNIYVMVYAHQKRLLFQRGVDFRRQNLTSIKAKIGLCYRESQLTCVKYTQDLQLHILIQSICKCGEFIAKLFLKCYCFVGRTRNAESGSRPDSHLMFHSVLKHATTLFALSDHYIISREWRVIVDQVQTNNHGRPIVL